MAGTPEWCALDASDPVKTAALLDAAQHWALRVETCQEAHCAASRGVSSGIDLLDDDDEVTREITWAELAREINQRADFYASRPWLKRVAS
jgi:Protein of unknown function (DUF2742)